MIESLFTETFSIKRRQTDTEDDWNESTFEIISDKPCLVLNRDSEIKTMESSSIGVSASTDGQSNKLVLLTAEIIYETDEIIYDSNIYMVGSDGLGKRKNGLTGGIYYYRVFLNQARPYLETTIPVKEV